MNQTLKLVIICLAVLVFVYAVVMCTGTGKGGDDDNKEDFTWANAVEELPGNYSLIDQEAAAMRGCSNGSGPTGFADIVRPANLPMATRPFDVIDQAEMMPTDPASVTSFDRDVTDPEVYLFRPAIRAQIKNRQQQGADPYRGDLPIVPCKKGWFDSRYGEGDNKLDAMFSEFNQQKYAALTGQRNIPQYVSAGEVIMDYNPEVVYNQ